MVREIPLTQGFVALIDDEDFDRVSQFKWFTQPASSGNGHYAVRNYGQRPNRGRMSLHQFLLGRKDGFEIDHRDGDKLNCQRANLRFATASQNLANQKLSKRNKSGYKGVSFSRSPRGWRAAIRANGRQKYLGCFETREDAAIAYDTAARQLFGEYARLNFPLDGEQAA